MRAIVFGAGGQLGSELSRLIGEGSGVAHDDVSVTDPRAVDALLSSRQPAVVFNCAAYNAVDRAESERELAYAVNSEGAANVARACARHRIRLVHFSTNFVFDGALGRPYVESDQPAPLSVYAASKLDGEQKVLELLPGALVVRASALYGDTGSAIKGGSFPERILSRARGGEPLRVVSDQKVNPTYTGDLAPAAIKLVESGLEGVVHVVSEGCAGWDEFARAVLDEFQVRADVIAASSGDLGSPAARPLNGCLASSRVDALRPWREGLHAWAIRRGAAEPSGR
ncbi:MAG TPA: dTDP-4-dehydrorhamnose reductase [Candidatus Dormibacteraeota bacterium]|nr:dTDP-4-dehydrorhamnose reductase [Candidatus Dormibacteraeota bacterium]